MEDLKRSLDHIQKDVEFANTFRLEAIKHLMSIAAGIFIFSVAFMKDIISPNQDIEYKFLLSLSWLLLVASLIAGIFYLKVLDKFYISYRSNNEKEKLKRKRIRIYWKITENLQVTFFITGVVFMALFAVANLH